MSETSVVYFSKDNNTRTGAQYVANREKAKIVELVENKKGNVLQAIFKKASKLQGNPWEDIKKSETVYLMMPIWASNGVPAMNSFLDKVDLTGKEIRIITFQQMENFKGSEKVHAYMKQRVEEKGGKVKDIFAFLGGKMGKCMPKEQIEGQVCSIFYDKGCCGN